MMRLCHVVVGCTLCAACASDPCRTLDDGRRLCGPDHATLAVEPGGSLVVRGKLQGRPVSWLIDSGAERTVVAPELVGVPDQSGVLVGELCLGDLCLEREPAWAASTPFSSAVDGEVNGFIGMSTLRDFVVAIDHDTQLTLAFRGVACQGTAHSMVEGDRGIHTVQTSIAGSDRGQLTLDTGSQFSVLSQTTADELAASLSNPVIAPLCTVNGCQPSGATTATVSEYCIAAECSSDVTVKYPVWDAIGFSSLARFRVDLDFVSHHLVFCGR